LSDQHDRKKNKRYCRNKASSRFDPKIMSSVEAESVNLGDFPWPGSIEEAKSTKFQIRFLLTVAGLLFKEGAQACGCDPSLLIGKSKKSKKGCALLSALPCL
jgi:hypothetical protein